MEDTRWLRLVTIGLVLAAMAVGYFLLAQRFTGTKVSDSKSDNSKTKVAVATPPTEKPAVPAIPTPLPSPTSAPSSAYDRIVERTKGGVTQLPVTGSPMILVGILSASAIIVGLGLRKFPD